MLKFKWETAFKETDIGKVSVNWENKKLGDVITLQRGKDLPTAKRSEGKYPVIGSTGVVGYHNQYVANGPGLLVGRSGSTGSLTYVNEPYWPLNTTLWVKDFKGNDPLFIYYFLHRMDFSLYSGGVSVPTLNRNILHPLEIGFPLLNEQKRITNVLSRFHDLIENKKRQNEIMEKIVIAIFRSWFVDFEPFKSGEFIDSGIERIPRNWEVVPVSEVAEFRNGISYKGEEKFDEVSGFVFITLNNIQRGGGFKTEYSWIKSDRIKTHHFLSEKDLIMANTDMTQDAKVIGSPAIVVFPYGYKDKGVYSHHITKITPKNQCFKLFLYLFLKITQEENTTFSTGTNVLGLDINNFKKNKLVLSPPQPFLLKFDSLVEPLFQKIILNQKQIMILRNIIDSLLPLLVFGKLRVEEI